MNDKFVTMTFNNMPDLPFETWEAINQLRTNLDFYGREKKIIMITSSIPDEGKSFVAVQLWKMLAETGQTALLIDCDLRNSEVRNQYGMTCSKEKPQGIVQYLSGAASLNDVIYATSIPRGYIMPMTAPIANPLVLLESPNLETVFSEARKVFDVIIVDTPPIQVVADALNISRYCDGAILVIRAGKTPRKMVSNSLSLLERMEIPLFGTVLNRMDTRTRSSRYNNYYYYSKYSSYDNGYNKKK